MFRRVHPCAYQLCKIVYGHLTDSEGYFQKQKITYSNMSTPLSSTIVEQLNQRDVVMRAVPGFRHNRPRALSQRKPPNPQVASVINYVQSSLPPELLENIRG